MDPSPSQGAEHRYASYRPSPTGPAPGTPESPLGPACAARQGRSRRRARPFPAAGPALQGSGEGAAERRRGGRADPPRPGGTRPLTRRASGDDLVRGLLQKAAGLPSHPRAARAWRAAAETRPVPRRAGGEEPGGGGSRAYLWGGGRGKAGRGRLGPRVKRKRAVPQRPLVAGG